MLVTVSVVCLQHKYFCLPDIGLVRMSALQQVVSCASAMTKLNDAQNDLTIHSGGGVTLSLAQQFGFVLVV